MMSSIQAFAAAIVAWIGGGALLPLLVSLVTKAHWDPKVKQFVMIAMSVALAVLTYLAASGWQIKSWEELFAAITAVVTGAQVAYHKLWSKGGVTQAISAATDGPLKTSKKNVVSPAAVPEHAEVIEPPEDTVAA